MLTAVVIANFAIALLCLVLAWRMVGVNRQITQLNRDLNRWSILLEDTLAQQALALTEKRADLRQWQLIHLKWQLQQRRLLQVAKVLRLISLVSRRRFL